MSDNSAKSFFELAAEVRWKILGSRELNNIDRALFRRTSKSAHADIEIVAPNQTYSWTVTDGNGELHTYRKEGHKSLSSSGDHNLKARAILTQPHLGSLPCTCRGSRAADPCVFAPLASQLSGATAKLKEEVGLIHIDYEASATHDDIKKLDELLRCKRIAALSEDARLLITQRSGTDGSPLRFIYRDHQMRTKDDRGASRCDTIIGSLAPVDPEHRDSVSRLVAWHIGWDSLGDNDHCTLIAPTEWGYVSGADSGASEAEGVTLQGDVGFELQHLRTARDAQSYEDGAAHSSKHVHSVSSFAEFAESEPGKLVLEALWEAEDFRSCLEALKTEATT